jgi:hypothetical protein
VRLTQPQTTLDVTLNHFSSPILVNIDIAKGKVEHKRASFIRSIEDPDGAVMSFNCAFDNYQPQTEAASICILLNEGLEQLRQQIIRHAAARVFDFEKNTIFERSRSKRNSTAL